MNNRSPLFLNHHKNIVLPLGSLLVVAGGIYLCSFDPAAPGALFPPCPIAQFTGLVCPGCGCTRALHALLHGQVHQALAWNPLIILLIPWLTLGFANEASRFWRGTPLWNRRLPAWVIWSGICLLLVYALMRNLPWPPFTLLAPHALL